ncbi:hypothetical protein CPK_ORF00715 [Chlamydia pneumoniae LPCoLN]|uniref:DUF648 domain-containing protein n=1 Tax=Chlamydia pneumoniae TaxID=83558 RepID=UPI0001BD9CFE|nr:DUF648 domain-containing protein [Chlamydia pneumoniae]ACZ33184.1 hypothetical protein CPK_ORF00715 [Chlamydia pneumoniae LPCoLN]ETR80096.1 hypothetical protein X556_0586 [Chlamydia pneumoniae B21]
MKTYSFSTGYQATNFSDKLMAQVDSYLFLGGTKTKIISISRDGFVLATEENVSISLIHKILKIILFLFLPLTLIALALRYLLHSRFDWKYPQNHFLTIKSPRPLPQDIETTLAANRSIFQNALENAYNPIFNLPKEYWQLSIVTDPQTQALSLTLSVDIDALLKNLNLIHVKLPTKHIQQCNIDTFGDPKEQELIQDLQSKEQEEFVSNEGKSQLARLLLEHLYLQNKNPYHTEIEIERDIWSRLRFPMYKTIWSEIFFSLDLDSVTMVRSGFGYKILQRIHGLSSGQLVCGIALDNTNIDKQKQLSEELKDSPNQHFVYIELQNAFFSYTEI